MFSGRYINLSDPRTYQVTILACLLAYGVLVLRFDVHTRYIQYLPVMAILVQWFCTRLWQLPHFDPKSALISSLSLCLLIRTDRLDLALIAITVTIASKFIIRIQNKHVFNPTNFGLAVMMLLSDEVWVSPGQWGSLAFSAFLFAGLGGLVVYRAARSDVTYAFLLAYTAMLFLRALWLGDPLSIPLHQIQNGAFLLFGFFMISDPRTTPNHRVGRILYAIGVALVAGWIQFSLFKPNALIWALICCAPLVPVIDRIFTGTAYRWPVSLSSQRSHS